MIYDASTPALPYEAPFDFSTSGASHCKKCGGRNVWRTSSASTLRDEGQARDVGRLSALAPPRLGPEAVHQGRFAAGRFGFGLLCAPEWSTGRTRQVAEG